jgi:hypothetical protein
VAELKPGEERWHHRIRPKPGYHNFTQLAKHLKCSHARLRKLCATLGIELTTYHRRDAAVNKRYKRHLRFLTDREVQRIVLLLREQQGKRALKRAEKELRA